MLSFVLDEHLRGPLWIAIQTHIARGIHPIDAVRVGDPTDLPLGTKDSGCSTGLNDADAFWCRGITTRSQRTSHFICGPATIHLASSLSAVGRPYRRWLI